MSFDPYKFLYTNPEFAGLFGGLPCRTASVKNVRVYKTDEERMEAFVDTKVQTVVFWSVDDLSLKELRQAANAMGVDTSQFLQKEEFKSAIDERRNKSCPICFDDYTKNEEVSVTLCGHFYHKDCLKSHVRSCVQRRPGEMATCALGCGSLKKRPERAVEVEEANQSAKRARR